jgi:hypothetical protein
MKTTVKSILSFLFLAGILYSCQKEYFPPVEISENQEVSLSKDLVPVFSANCSMSGCHSGAVPPDLTATNAYTSLVEGAQVDTLNPEQSLIYKRINGGGMPPGGKLPAKDIQLVLQWIKQGAHDN